MGSGRDLNLDKQLIRPELRHASYPQPAWASLHGIALPAGRCPWLAEELALGQEAEPAQHQEPLISLVPHPVA